MDRRTFTRLAAAAPALAGAERAEVALLTHAEGAHLSAYVEALGKLAEVGVVHLCDESGVTVETVRKGVGAKLGGVYRSPDELFAAHQPALALVTMEAVAAPPVIDRALEANCHVLAEKPACVRAEDFAPLVEKAVRRRRNLMLALANRVDPVMEEARRMVQAGEIGRLYGMELHTIADQTRLTRPAYQRTWFARKARAGGGHLIWLGIHWLDLAVFLAGSRITQVTGFTANVGGQPIDVEDSAAVCFRFANGTLGNLTSGYYLDRGKQLFIKMWGSAGWLEINHGTEQPLEWYSTRAGKGVTRQWAPAPNSGGYTPLVAHAVKAALGLETPVVSADESLHVLRTIFAAYRAAETGVTQMVG
jgi:predicted dehydrogenase